MKRNPPEKVSEEEITLSLEEIEPLLSGPQLELPPFEPAMVKLKNGKTMVLRELRKDEAEQFLGFVNKLVEEDHDFYDIIGARVYAEVLGWLRNRLKDSYQMVGIVDGELAGFCNGRKMNDRIHISLHSMGYMRGVRVDAAVYYAKAQHAFETLGAEEWWSTFESYNSWRRYGLGMAQPSYPWPEYQHELGGAPVYYIRRDYWFSSVKQYLREMVGDDLTRPVPDDLLKASETMRIPESPNV